MNTQILEVRNESGNERFNALMEATYRKVYNMAFRLAGNKSDAEDLTQEAYYRAFRSFQDYEGDKPFENWIFRIVTRLFLDLLRSRRRRVQTVSYDAPLPTQSEDTVHFDVADPTSASDAPLMSVTLNEELQGVLNSLSPEQHTLVMLADIEGLPYKEISEIMNKPVGTIRSRLHRTHKLMRQRLEQMRDRKASAAPAAKMKSMAFA